MKWMLKLFQKAATQPPTAIRQTIVEAAKSEEDLQGLRNALVTTLDEAERPRLATRLGRSLALQAQAPLGEDPLEVWIAAVCHAPDKAKALAWLGDLNGDSALAEVAMQARGAEVRFAAAQRIGASKVLEQVAQASRDKDKRVHRHCIELLRQRRQAEVDAQRATAIADELRHLLDSAPLPVSRLLELKHELANLAQAGTALQDCSTLLEQAHTRLHIESEARRNLQTSQSAAAALASECLTAVWPWDDRLDAWRTRLDSLARVLAELPAWLAEQAAARALAAELAKVEARLAQLAADIASALACDQFLAGLEAGTPADEAAAGIWNRLAKPGDQTAHQILEDRWQALHAMMVKPAPVSAPTPAPAAPPKPASIDRDALRDLLDKLEAAIEEGHLLAADAASKQIKLVLAGNSLQGAQESRWHHLQAQVETLRGWARWGTGQAREQLIASAQALLDGERTVDELARAIPALRDAWKRLNAHAPSSQAQWESFDAALEKAYAPVADQRAADAARHDAARVAKEALCAEWQAELAGVVWEHADYKVIESRRAEILKQWHAAPQAGFRHERTLRKRFDALIGDMDQRLDAARSTEFMRREQLITEAESLSGQTELGQAMTQAKALQVRWNQEGLAVRLKRKEEQQLWQRFRAACNAVFERRDAQRAEQAAQRQEHAQSRQTLLEAFAATLATADTNGIKQALMQFRVDWGRPRPNGREADDPLDIRARDLQQQAQQRIDEQRNEKYRARFDLLARKAALAERVEAAALAAEPLESIVAEARRDWDNLPPLPSKTESLLAKRLTGANSVTRAQVDAGHEARKSILLDLEIALDLPSPATYAAIRRERQLARLQNRFAAPTAQDQEPGEMLAQWYATAALPDAAMDARIAEVIRRLAAQAGGA